MSSNLWSRLRHARLAQVILLYLGASWLILEVGDVFIDKFEMPGWFFQAAILLLMIGFVIVVATSLVQSRPASATSDDRTLSPWEVDLVDLKDSVTRGRMPHLTWARAILGGVFAFSLLFGFAGLYVLLRERGTTIPTTSEAFAAPAPGIAVLPFRTIGPDLELWREGMVDLLSTNLDGAAGLRTINPRTLVSRWERDVGSSADAVDLQTALQVSQAVGAAYAVMGSAVSFEGGVRLTCEVYDAQTADLKGRAQVEGSTDSIFSLVDALSLEVLKAGLVGDPDDLPTLGLRQITTSSLPALKSYLEGEQKFRRSRFREAIADYTRAVEADPTFALALSRISNAYGWVEAFSERVIEYGRRAAQLIDRLPEREAMLMRGNAQRDEFRLSAIETFEEFTARYPDDVEGWEGLGEAYYHVGEQALLQRDRYRAAFRRAVELDPGFGPVYVHLIDDALTRQDSAAARDLVDRHRQIDPTSPHAIGLGLVYALTWGDNSSEAHALAALDTASADVLFTAFARFWYSAPHYSEAARAVAEAIFSPRHPLTARTFALLLTARSRGVSGHMREARAAVDSMARTLGDEGIANNAARFHLLSHLTLYPDLSRAGLAAELLATDPGPWDRFLLGAFAATEGRWEDVSLQVEALESGAREAAAEGDSLSAADSQASAQALRGYAALRRGDHVTASREISGSLPRVSVPGINSLLRYELGRLWLQTGDPEEAERYFKSLEVWNVGAIVPITTPTEYYLGEVYEALGDNEKAKLHYGRFVRWWEGSDPELHDWWERGREALERLTAES